ncbi:MAG TPA: RNA polymerase sigma-70 factor [Puia sp.]|jgi:RNA polymerase sigma-70 factor (family 1)|nr:RNA polymerase sigma-70 factor [Puia sp.]
MRKKNEYTDQQPVDDFAKGSQKAFAKLFHEFYPALCFYATGFTNNQQAAEDIVEEIFIVAWNRRESFDHYKVLRSFLYSSVRNACLNWIKQKARHAAHEKRIAISEELTENSILENIVRAEVFREVYSAFEKLPPKCREIFSLIFFEGKNIRDVASELKLSVNTVKAQKRRGLLLLRDKLTIFLILVL